MDSDTDPSAASDYADSIDSDYPYEVTCMALEGDKVAGPIRGCDESVVRFVHESV